jgi:HAD superfamily hydrolase (TIGR01450 family)
LIPSTASVQDLAPEFDALLFDSFGVLVDGVDALPGAPELLNHLDSIGKSYFVVTNDASKSIKARVDTFREQGFKIPAEKIINSGGLLVRYFAEHKLDGKPTLVLGTEDSADYVRQAGGELIDQSSGYEPDVVVLGHSGPHDWESTLGDLLGLISRRYQQSSPINLVVPNPDFIYPNGPGEYGFGAAAFIDVLEQALFRLHGDHPVLKAAKLGKPFPTIFEEAIDRAGSSNLLMVGDQLETDVLGANKMYLKSAVVTTGINRRTLPDQFKDVDNEMTPDYLIESLV